MSARGTCSVNDAPLSGGSNVGESGASTQAAAHIGRSRNALYKLTAARAIPFEQDCPGGKLYFKRSQLDDWRERGGAGKQQDKSVRFQNASIGQN